MRLTLVCEGLNRLSARAQPWKHVVEMTRRIKEVGHDVQILSDGRNKLGADDEVEGLKVRRIARKGFLLDTEELVDNIINQEVDLINLHGSDTWSSFYLSCFKRVESTTVWTLHSGPLTMHDLRGLSLQEKLQLYKYWNNLLNSVFPSYLIRRWIRTSRLKHIIALSNRLERRLKSLNSCNTAISVIRSGIDTRQFRPLNKEDARDSLGFPHRHQIVLYYGPLSSFRGVDTLIRAMPTIKREIPEAKLVLLGRGSAKNVKQSNFASDAIELHEQILDEDTLIQYLAAADLVVLPFKFWPQVECPLTVLEAMAMGKPVISTSTGAISEIINSGDNGVLIPPAQPDILARKGVELFNDPEMCNHLGTNARRYVEAFCDWDAVVKQTLTVFEAALGKT